MNRLYGIERDRPTLKKYGRAFVLTISAGLLAVGAFVVMFLGQGVGSSLDSPSRRTSGTSSAGRSRSSS